MESSCKNGLSLFDMVLSFSFKNKLKSFLINIFLLILGSFLFAFSNPGFVFSEGLGFLAWIAYIPVFVLVYRLSFKTVWIYGFVYGVFSYMLYVSWLVIFSPVGSIAIEAMYGVFLMLTFVAMKACCLLFPKKWYLASFLACLGYEYLKTIGFAGFSYGVTAYTQWKNPVLIQCADLGGVWLLSAVVLFSSAWLSNVLVCFFKKSEKSAQALVQVLRENFIPAFVWFVVLVAIVVYGFASVKDYSAFPKVKVAAIQHNTDPWLSNDVEAYAKDVDTLIALSNQALKEQPDTALVVWPETSVIPPILKHYHLRRDRNRFNLIKRFLDFVESQQAVFVIGNDQQDDFYSPDPADYNGVLVFSPKKNTLPPEPEIYRKIHLVPFTESFPWSKQFPSLYEALLNGDTHLWSQGNEYVVFRQAGLAFSTPVCFEDTFGDTGFKMFRAGARAFVNLSNDAWSKSLACQNQHLAMARFRCVENRIPAVRSTASGQTCIIDPNGIITAMAQPFAKTYVTGEIPVIPNDAEQTVYCRTGDVLGQFFAAAAFVLILSGIVRCVFRKITGNS